MPVEFVGARTVRAAAQGGRGRRCLILAPPIEIPPAAVPMPFMIPTDHPSLPGHFPGRPLVPGVVVLDRVLEAIESRDGTLPAGLRLPQVKFVQPLLPGEEAQVELDGVAPRWRFRVLRGDVLLASGEVVAGTGASGTAA